MVENIVYTLGVGEPDIDAFADVRNHRFPRWWGQGGEHSDAFSQNWGNGVLLWCNPPYFRLGEVACKLIRDQARCILVVPNWQLDQLWWHEIWPYVRGRVSFSKGVELFEVDGRSVPLT